jgi:agmatine/peptidylarginine deiminase
MNKKYLLVLALLSFGTFLFSQQLTPERLKQGRWLSQEEYDHRGDVGKFFNPTDAPEGPINPVGEFEPMQSVIIAYPFGIPIALVAEMSEIVTVITIVENNSQITTVTNQYQANGVNMDNVDFLVAAHDTYWTRDYGPWFIREEDQVSIVDFTYNRPRPDDDIMPQNVASMLGIPFYSMPVIHTGGNYMCDGFHIAAQTELVYEENSISDSQVDQYMEDYLGVTENFVITDPLGDYIKHIDCWGKFLDTDKVLISQVPESDPRYDDYEAAADYFASRNCAYGYPFEVIRVYAPGTYPYTPYSNSLILNNKVFLPITGSQWDDEAIVTYEAAMPGYEIVPILSYAGDWLNTDALHCRTHEIADIGMLKITHIPPFHGEVDFQASFNIEVKIHAYSNENIYADSVLLVYQFNSGEFQSVVMQSQGDEIYSAALVANPGDVVGYYIHAADESGRSENVPYIGHHDPFVFTVKNLDYGYLALSPDTVFLPEADEPRLVVKNPGTLPVSINNIRPEYEAETLWMIDHTVPAISEYPYELNPGDSIEIFIMKFITGKPFFYDSLLVSTDDSLYHSILVNDGVGIAEMSEASFSLSPNPISTQGEIVFETRETGFVELSIYNLTGQPVKTIESSNLPAGTHSYQWNGQSSKNSSLPQGTYLVKLKMGNEVQIKKWIKI